MLVGYLRIDIAGHSVLCWPTMQGYSAQAVGENCLLRTIGHCTYGQSVIVEKGKESMIKLIVFPLQGSGPPFPLPV